MSRTSIPQPSEPQHHPSPDFISPTFEHPVQRRVAGKLINVLILLFGDQARRPLTARAARPAAGYYVVGRWIGRVEPEPALTADRTVGPRSSRGHGPRRQTGVTRCHAAR
eukprot:7050653-Prymnesium_polylepis.1